MLPGRRRGCRSPLRPRGTAGQPGAERGGPGPPLAQWRRGRGAGGAGRAGGGVRARRSTSLPPCRTPRVPGVRLGWAPQAVLALQRGDAAAGHARPRQRLRRLRPSGRWQPEAGARLRHVPARQARAHTLTHVHTCAHTGTCVHTQARTAARVCPPRHGHAHTHTHTHVRSHTLTRARGWGRARGGSSTAPTPVSGTGSQRGWVSFPTRCWRRSRTLCKRNRGFSLIPFSCAGERYILCEEVEGMYPCERDNSTFCLS